MELGEFVKQIEPFDGYTTREKCRVFAWFIHTYKKAEFFSPKK